VSFASSFVVVQAKRFGWSVVKVRPAKTSPSVYIELRSGSNLATVRLSDHKPCESRKRMLSVQHNDSWRLQLLAAFLLAGGVYSPDLVATFKRADGCIRGSEATVL
jgi:hypothetical protein